MPLTTAAKAKIAFWLCAAQALDADTCALETEAERQMLAEARDSLALAATSADRRVPEPAALRGFLREVAQNLESLAASAEATAPGAAKATRAAAGLLSSMAVGAQEDGNGDGPVWQGVRGGEPCSCGLLQAAAEVETRGRQLLQELVGIPTLTSGPTIHYVTVVATEEGAREFEGFCIGAKAETSDPPRRVTLMLRPRPLVGQDLWHIAYALHHELFCHAFQAFEAGNIGVPDAPPRCCWSEGWMDALAYELTEEWTQEGPAWLPLRGEMAKDALRRMHAWRYDGPPGLAGDDLRRRQGARDAYKSFARLLRDHGLARTESEATCMARRFSLAAQAAAAADWRRLSGLAKRLVRMFASTARRSTALEAAQRCLAFTRHQNLAELEKDLAYLAEA